jgi:hypothetical protein
MSRKEEPEIQPQPTKAGVVNESDSSSDSNSGRPERYMVFYKEIDEMSQEVEIPLLNTSDLNSNDLEVRVWVFQGVMYPYGVRFQRLNGIWKGANIRVNFKEVPKYNLTDLAPPDKGWEEAWKSSQKEGILSLKQCDDLSGGADTGCYVIEYKIKNQYRTFVFEAPETSTCPDAKKALKIVKLFSEKK